MSLDNYYEIQKETIDESKAIFHISLNSLHNVYKGHFPEFPLLPGAIQIELIQELLEKAIGKNVELKAAKNIKYLGMINPFEHTLLTIDLQWNIKETIKLKAIIKSSNAGEPIMLKYSSEYIF